MIIGFQVKGSNYVRNCRVCEFLVCCHRKSVLYVTNKWDKNFGGLCDIDERGEWHCAVVCLNWRATVEQITSQMNQGVTTSVSKMTVQWSLVNIRLCSRWMVKAPMTVYHPKRLEFYMTLPILDIHWLAKGCIHQLIMFFLLMNWWKSMHMVRNIRKHPSAIYGWVYTGRENIIVFGMVL